MATLTVRLIKSFEYKNYRNLVFHDLDLQATNLSTLENMIKERIAANPVLARLFPADKAFLDTFKVYYHPHAAKTNNPIINVGEDEKLILCDFVKPLSEFGLTNQSEISYFNWEAYQVYCQDPKALWE